MVHPRRALSSGSASLAPAPTAGRTCDLLGFPGLWRQQALQGSPSSLSTSQASIRIVKGRANCGSLFMVTSQSPEQVRARGSAY